VGCIFPQVLMQLFIVLYAATSSRVTPDGCVSSVTMLEP